MPNDPADTEQAPPSLTDDTQPVWRDSSLDLESGLDVVELHVDVSLPLEPQPAPQVNALYELRDHSPDALDGDSAFKTWLGGQGFAEKALEQELLSGLRRDFDEGELNKALWKATRPPARSPRSPDRRYAIAIRDGNDLCLTFWIKRSVNGQIFLLYPREREVDAHASYHRDGTYHQKSYKFASSKQQRQPLNANFRGSESLGKFYGHGAGQRIEDPSSFDDVLIVPAGILQGTTGSIVIDLVEAGGRPAPHHRDFLRILDERVYCDAVPWIVVAIALDEPPMTLER